MHHGPNLDTETPRAPPTPDTSRIENLDTDTNGEKVAHTKKAAGGKANQGPIFKKTYYHCLYVDDGFFEHFT